MKIVSLIPARGGSKGIPRKNIKLLSGKPLISYIIKSSTSSKYIDETYVSTDDVKIAKISKKNGATIVKRPLKYALDNSSSESVLLHFAKKINFDILVFLQCTSPLTATKDIDGAIEFFLKNSYNSVLSVCEDRGGFLCGGFLWYEDGKPVNYDYKNRPRRQDMKKTFRENGAIYIISKNNLLKYKNRLCKKVGLYVMPGRRSFEIDEPQDFKLLNKILPILK